MEYMSTKEASAKWGISERRIHKLCEKNGIDGVVCSAEYAQFQKMLKGHWTVY